VSHVDLVVIGDVNPDLVVSAPDLRVEFGQREVLANSAELRLAARRRSPPAPHPGSG